MHSWQRLFWLTGIFSAVVLSAAAAKAETQIRVADPATDPQGSDRATAIAGIDLPQPATTVAEWIAQIEASRVQITGVRVESTETGLQVVLETADGELSTPTTETVGNAVIAEIPNAVLALPEGDAFEQFDPAEGIALVSVTGLPGRVRVSITGTDAPPEAQVRTEAGNLVFGVVPGIAQAGDADDAIQIVVTGERDTGYRVERATTATRTNTPIRDVPQSIQVIPRQVLEDQQVTQISDAFRNVSGIASSDSSLTPAGDTTIIRGFRSFDNFYTNGIRNRGAGDLVQQELSNVERIEILRGPASVLYGRGEPGGLINLVTELPTSEPYYAFEGTIGNFDFYRPRIDISGPLNPENTIGYRLNASYQNAGSFVDFMDVERIFVAPVLSFQFSENTSLIFEGSYLRDSRFRYPGLPAVGTVLPNPFGRIPRSRNLSDPDAGNETGELINIGYRLEHEFNENLSIRNAFRVELSALDRDQIISSISLRADNRTVDRFASRTRPTTQAYSLVTDILGQVNTGSIEHDLLFGIDLRRQNLDVQIFSASAGSIDLFNPVYGLPDLDFQEVFTGTQVQDSLGIYAQDLISFSDNFKLLLGGRFDLINQRFTNELAGTPTISQQDTQFSPRIGLVYQPIPPVSLYANWSRSFFAQGLFGSGNPDGSNFEPTTGEQFEVGVKTEFLDGRLAATLAAYDITKRNIVTADPDRPNFSIQVGEQRSRGIEFDIAGEVLPGLNLIASYAYTDAEITRDNRGFEGNQPNNVPRHSGSLWATYQIQQGSLEGLGFGLGVFIVGDRKGDLANTFELPGYTRTDASIFYRRDRWQAQLNVRNLFGVNYFENASNRNNVGPGAPFTILGTVSVSF